MRQLSRFGLLLIVMGVFSALIRLLRRRQLADLRGETVLITGSSRGLGLLLAREFGHEGCRVAICARDSSELDAARDLLAQEGVDDVFTVTCDVSDSTQVAEMIERTTEHFGRIDILVNNAGLIQVGPLETNTLQDFRDAVGVMQWGTVFCTLGVLPDMMRRRQGRIVNITSIGGKLSIPHLLPYSTAKFAAVGFTEGLRAELAPKGIQVTTIVPGLMRTGSQFNGLFKGDAVREFTWFGVAGSLPIMSMDAERAAREIVLATRRGDAERILTLPAVLAVRLHGLFPGLTVNLFALAHRMILPPAPGADPTAVRGADAFDRLPLDSVRRTLQPNVDAAWHLNQFATQPPPARVLRAPL